MEARTTSSATRWLLFAVILLGGVVLTFAAVRHALAEYWEGTSNPGLWLRAAKIEPSNGDNWYRLGRYWQLDFEHTDLPQAISYYQHATEIDPGSSSFWMDLGSAYETAGDTQRAELAFQKAQQDYPISAQVAWAYGSFLLREDRRQEAYQQIKRAISGDPNLTALAVSRCWRSTQDIDQIVKSVLPETPEAYWGAIEFFVTAEEPDAATAVWKRLTAEKISFPVSKAFPLIDMLIQSGHADDARFVWEQALSAAGIAPEYDPNSVIWNGGFEHDLLNGGLSWQYRTAGGADMELDEETFHSGHRSLRVTFDGTENVDFGHLWQNVVVQPNTHYRFSAYIQTQELTTDNGIRFAIVDQRQGGSTVTTPNIVGTQPWALDDVELTTGPQTRLLQIVLRRLPSNMLGNKIRGTAWVDDVSLVALPKTKPVIK